MKIGTRVKVSIANPEYYSMGCAESLEGKTGTIEEYKSESWVKCPPGPVYLVKFDTPPEKWWSGQQPNNYFWFPHKDLRRV